MSLVCAALVSRAQGPSIWSGKSTVCDPLPNPDHRMNSHFWSPSCFVLLFGRITLKYYCCKYAVLRTMTILVFMTAALAYKRVVCQFEYTGNSFRLFTPQLCQSVSVKTEVMSGYQFVCDTTSDRLAFFTLRTKMEKYSDNYLHFHICWTQFKTII